MAFYIDYFLDTFKIFEELFQGYDFVEATFCAGQFLSVDENDRVYYIKSGRVGLICSNQEGKTYSLLRMPQGNLIPFNYQRDHFFHLSTCMSIQFLVDTEVISFSMETFRQLILHNGDFALACLEYSAKINNLYQYEIMALTVMDSKQRIYRFIHMLHMYGRTTGDMMINYTQEEIAEEIGITRIQLGRVLKELREENIISTKRNMICVKDLEGLIKKINSQIS